MAAANTSNGVIEAGAVYTLPELKRRAGVAEWWLRTARRNGLRVIRAGNRGYVRGEDFISYLDKLASADEAGGGHA